MSCGQDVPDHATIARFRAEYQDPFAVLFTQVLQVAGAAGLARFGTVAIDGTKIPANASIDANRAGSGGGAGRSDPLAEAQGLGAAEDTAFADGSNDWDGSPARRCARSAPPPTRARARFW
jgi:hypothetical protein